MIVLDYCLNEKCIELAIKNKLFCKTCFNKNITHLLHPFLKGWLARYKTKKYFNAITTIQSFVMMKSITKYFNSPLFISSSYLTPDEGIIKHILKKGDKCFPKKKQLVYIHYIGRHINGNIFYNSYNDNIPLEFELGNDNYMKLWNIGVSSMSRGEKCILIGLKEYCKQGELLNFPVDENLIFELELINFKDTVKIQNMSLEDRLTSVYNYKNEGDILYKNNKLKNASYKYNQALDYLFEEDEDPEKMIIINNLCNIYENLSHWNECLKFCKSALQLTQEDTTQYLYKIAKSYYYLKNYDNCINICNKILYKDKKLNTELNELFTKALSFKTFENENEKNMYNIMFNTPHDTH